MLSIRRALFLVCLMLIAGPVLLLAFLWASAHGTGFDAASAWRLMPSIIAAALLIAALVAIRVGLIIVGPIDALHHAAQRMAEGDLTVRAPAADRLAPRELHALTATFNEMAASVARSREQVERANSSKSEFVRMVTHELRSPVSAIIGFSELLSGRNGARLPPEARDSYLRDINAGAKHLLALVNDLLDLAKAEAGQYELADDEVWLDEIMHRAVRYVEPQARERQMQVSVVLKGEAPCVRGDERALFQVLLNLASNAVRYGRTGGSVNITYEWTETQDCIVAVRDDGPGIDADDLQRVMLPFQRAKGVGDDGASGSGLGLPIVKKLVELHGGSFRLLSTAGAGTTARVLLPASRVVYPKTTAAKPANGNSVAWAA